MGQNPYLFFFPKAGEFPPTGPAPKGKQGHVRVPTRAVVTVRCACCCWRRAVGLGWRGRHWGRIQPWGLGRDAPSTTQCSPTDHDRWRQWGTPRQNPTQDRAAGAAGVFQGLGFASGGSSPSGAFPKKPGRASSCTARGRALALPGGLLPSAGSGANGSESSPGTTPKAHQHPSWHFHPSGQKKSKSKKQPQNQKNSPPKQTNKQQNPQNKTNPLWGSSHTRPRSRALPRALRGHPSSRHPAALPRGPCSSQLSMAAEAVRLISGEAFRVVFYSGNKKDIRTAIPTLTIALLKAAGQKRGVLGRTKT